MADETSWAVALWVKYGQIEAILLSSRYSARHTLLMCCCIDSVWSRWTPRFLTEDLNGMRLPPMSTLSLPTELRREVDATGRTSVFSAFVIVSVRWVGWGEVGGCEAVVCVCGGGGGERGRERESACHINNEEYSAHCQSECSCLPVRCDYKVLLV